MGKSGEGSGTGSCGLCQTYSSQGECTGRLDFPGCGLSSPISLTVQKNFWEGGLGEITVGLFQVILLPTHPVPIGWLEGMRLSDGERGWFPVQQVEFISNPEVRARNLKEAHRVKTAKLQLVEQQT